MNAQLKKLKDITSESCVTIILNTHRTHPQSKKDALVLKNLIKEAGQRLSADESKRDVKKLMQKLSDLESQIDHNHNLESLVLFVNEDIAEYIRLPIVVKERVVIDHTFATRDLVRALHSETNYYVLVLSQQKARLIEAFNDKVVAEIGKPFPIENTQFYSTTSADVANAPRQANLRTEFFKSIDKAVTAVRKENPLPVLICTEESNYYEYIKIVTDKQSIFDTYLNKNRMNEKPDATIRDAWEIVKEYTVQKNNDRKAELQKAVSQKKVLSDTNDIWQGIQQGRIQTLFIEKGKFQPAIWINDVIKHVSDDVRDKKKVVDDVYDELIEANMNFGGDVVFLPKGELAAFDGFGAITRY